MAEVVPEPAAPLVRPEVVTSRRTWSHKRRRLAVWSPEAGELVDDAGRLVRRRPSTDLGDALDAAQYGDARAVYVVGADAVAVVRGWAEVVAPPGWEHRSAYASDSAPVVELEHTERRHRVRIAVGAQWTGEQLGARATSEVLRVLRDAIEARWSAEGGTLLGSPATTGRDLMARTLPAGHEWPVLGDEVAETIRATCGQHRLDRWAPVGAEVPALVEVDARLAYAAVTWGLPVGVPVRRLGPPLHARGRWRGRCSWTVPAGWRGPGVLPVLSPDGWSWPAEPGRRCAGWLDGAEVDLAGRLGWPVVVHECMEWPTGPDPLRRWTERLVELYGTAGAGCSAEVAAGVRAGVRAVLLHAIGALHAGGQVVSRLAPVDRAGEVPADALSVSVSDDGASVVWTERRRAAWPEMCRPEWTATIWARTRCRLLDAPGAEVRGRRTRVGALHLPAGVEVVWCRGDALYLTGDPGWHDDGAPGRYRVKAEHGALVVPATLPALDELRRRPPTSPESYRAGLASARAALEVARG